MFEIQSTENLRCLIEVLNKRNIFYEEKVKIMNFKHLNFPFSHHELVHFSVFTQVTWVFIAWETLLNLSTHFAHEASK